MGAAVNNAELNEGDLIVALGSTQTDQGIEKYHRVLAEIIVSGEKDVFASVEGTGRVFKISKSRCVKIPNRQHPDDESVLTPRIGDLVVSLSDRYSGREKKMGLLIEISDVPGRGKTGKLLEGEATEIVSFDALIVVESGTGS